MKTTLVKRALLKTAASVHMSVDLINFTTKKDLLRSQSKFYSFPSLTASLIAALIISLASLTE